MGNLLSCIGKSNLTTELIELSEPDKCITLPMKEVHSILMDQLQIVNSNNVRLADNKYLTISEKDLRRFLKFDLTEFMGYKKNIFDCDDFALIMTGKQHAWFAKLNLDGGSTFGMVWGDIKKNETDKKPRYHAMNFFITNEKKVLLVEPQNDIVYPPTSNSTFWFAIC